MPQGVSEKLAIAGAVYLPRSIVALPEYKRRQYKAPDYFPAGVSLSSTIEQSLRQNGTHFSSHLGGAKNSDTP
ncbi:hypothetical protein ACXYL9_10130 [Qipengyuania sp. CAU 1752]